MRAAGRPRRAETVRLISTTLAAHANRRLASLIREEAGFSHAGLARRVDQLGLEHGADTCGTTRHRQNRWLQGAAAAQHHPRADRQGGLHPGGSDERLFRAGPRARRLRARLRGPGVRGHPHRGGRHRQRPLAQGAPGTHTELRKIAFTPAGLVVPSRDWLIGRADEWVARDGGAARRAGGEAGAPAPGRTDPGRTGSTGLQAPGVRTGRCARAPEPAERPARDHSGPRRPGPPPRTRPRRTRPPPGPTPGARRCPWSRASARPTAAPASGSAPGTSPPCARVGGLLRTLDHAYGGGHARRTLVRYLEREGRAMLRGTYSKAAGRTAVRRGGRPDPAGRLDLVDIAAHGLAQRSRSRIAPARPGRRGPRLRRLCAAHHPPGRPSTWGTAGKPSSSPASPSRASARPPRRSSRRCCTRSRRADARCSARRAPAPPLPESVRLVEFCPQQVPESRSSHRG
ncbi:hypothetical protein SBADM41S_04470 [Streptomyces badius]